MYANKGRLKKSKAGGSCGRRSPTMATMRLLLGLSTSIVLFLVVTIPQPTTAAAATGQVAGIGEVGGYYEEAENQNNNLLTADEIRSDRVRRSPTTTVSSPIRSSTSAATVDSSTAYDADFLGEWSSFHAEMGVLKGEKKERNNINVNQHGVSPWGRCLSP